jgi:uncharacterized protein YjbI with pentapeptide repeats
LPADIEALSHRNAHEISDNRWSYDTGLLVAAIEKLTGRQRTRRLRSAAIAGCLVLALSAALWNIAKRSTTPASSAEPARQQQSTEALARPKQSTEELGRRQEKTEDADLRQESTEEAAHRKALGDLDSRNLTTRIAAIRSLERLARGSDQRYPEIIETLTRFVRQQAPLRQDEVPSVAKDVQEALTVLGRRRKLYGAGEQQRLDLSGIEVSGADLREAHFEGTNLQRSNLRNVNFWSAHLQGADMGGCDLRGANLELANLENALLWASHEVPPKRASNLMGATLTAANIKGAHLEAANLYGVIGLTAEQLRTAIINENTGLPDYLRGYVSPRYR